MTYQSTSAKCQTKNKQKRKGKRLAYKYAMPDIVNISTMIKLTNQKLKVYCMYDVISRTKHLSLKKVI